MFLSLNTFIVKILFVYGNGGVFDWLLNTDDLSPVRVGFWCRVACTVKTLHLFVKFYTQGGKYKIFTDTERVI